jgi:hypothetical protein
MYQDLASKNLNEIQGVVDTMVVIAIHPIQANKQISNG